MKYKKKKKQYPDQPNEIIGPLIEKTNELIRLLKQINLYNLIQNKNYNL